MEFINLSSTASTLLITLYSRAAMSKNNMIIEDKKAEQIIAIAGYDQKKLKVSKKLQALLTIRAYLIDVYTKEFIEKHRQLMTKKGYDIIEIRGLTYFYKRNNDKGEC